MKFACAGTCHFLASQSRISPESGPAFYLLLPKKANSAGHPVEVGPCKLGHPKKKKELNILASPKNVSGLVFRSSPKIRPNLLTRLRASYKEAEAVSGRACQALILHLRVLFASIT